MHELTITEAVVADCVARCRGRRVLRVEVELGRWADVAADTLEYCFAICAEGTPVEGAELRMVESSEPALRVREMRTV